MTECKHFDLWDSGSETVSDWGEKLDQAHDDHLRIRDESINNLLEREDIDQECLNLNKEQKLWSAEEYREQVGLPITCPHETVDGKDYCIFHLSPESRQNLGITKEDVLNELVNKIKKSTGEDEDKKKCFAGAFLEDISIKYRGLSSESNKPVQFHFAKIDNLDLSHSVIDERFVFNGSEINEINCESTQFKKSVSFKKAELNCQSVLFDRATFEDRLDMSNTKINTKELNFKECSFRKRVNLSGMNVEIDLDSKDDIDTRVQYNNSVFHDELHHNNITFSFEDPDKLTEIYAEFKHCRFSSRANFSDCDFQSTLDDNTTDPSPYDLLEVSTDDLSKEDSEHEIEWYVDFSKSEFESGLLLNDLDLLGI
ncbi:hypothetical protein [Halonotius sp. GCM10025705]|uniref:hypothetical protein n=1 Tax=Halonotius sp. GCM10025705 TaxID=3252678 RepID=UPI003618AF60